MRANSTKAAASLELDAIFTFKEQRAALKASFYSWLVLDRVQYNTAVLRSSPRGSDAPQLLPLAPKEASSCHKLTHLTVKTSKISTVNVIEKVHSITFHVRYEAASLNIYYGLFPKYTREINQMDLRNISFGISGYQVRGILQFHCSTKFGLNAASGETHSC